MTTPERWLPLIQAAHSHAALVGVMREYVATLLPSDLERLPENCRDLGFQDATGLAERSFDLIREELIFSGPADEEKLLREVALMFGAAARRLVEIGPLGDS